MRDKLRRAAAVAGAMLMLSACGIQGEDVVAVPEYEYGESVNAAIMDVAQGGDAVMLQDVTSFEWDEVALFSEGATRDEIEELVGPSGLQGKRFVSSTNLLVFRQDGDPVALQGTSADVFDGEFGMLLGGDAVIAPVENRSGLVVLTEEG